MASDCNGDPVMSSSGVGADWGEKRLGNNLVAKEGKG